MAIRKDAESSKDRDPARGPSDARFSASGRAPQAEHILAATYTVLARNGFAGLSMAKIAEEANVNKRMLHYYFDTKERLIEEMAKSLLTMLYEQVKVATAGFADNPGAVFTNGVDRAWQVVTENRELVAAYISIASQAVFDERLAKQLYRNKQLVREMMKNDLEAIVATGNWRLKTDPEVIAELSVALFQGFVLEWVERGDDEHLLEGLNRGRKLILSLGEPIS